MPRRVQEVDEENARVSEIVKGAEEMHRNAQKTMSEAEAKLSLNRISGPPAVVASKPGGGAIAPPDSGNARGSVRV